MPALSFDDLTESAPSGALSFDDLVAPEPKPEGGALSFDDLVEPAQPAAQESNPVAEFGATVAENVSNQAAGALRGVDAVKQELSRGAGILQGQPAIASDSSEYERLKAELDDLENIDARTREGVNWMPDPAIDRIRSRMLQLEKDPEQKSALETGAQAAADIAARSRSDYGLPEERGKSAADQIARGAANVVSLAPAVAAGGLGLPVAAAQGGAQAYEEGYKAGEKQAVDAGETDPRIIEERAHTAASAAAVKSAPALAAYFVGGKLASAAVAKLLPEASALVKGVAGAIAGTGANAGTSEVLRRLDGDTSGPTIESLTQDALFGVIHGAGEYAGASAKAKAAAQAEIERRAAATAAENLEKVGAPETAAAVKETASQPEPSPTPETPARPETETAAPEATPEPELPVPTERTQVLGDEALKETAPEIETKPAEVVSEPAKEEALADDWTSASLPDVEGEAQPTATPATSEPLGILPQGLPQMMKGAQMAKEAVKRLASAVRDIPKFHDFRRSVLDWSAKNQRSTGEIQKVFKDVTKAVPDPIRREAITNWIQAGGDTALLQNRASGTKNLKLRKGYEAALSLTPEEQAVASKIRQTYDTLLQRANQHGIEINEIDNYVNQIWKQQPLKDFVASSNRKLSTSVRFAKKRFYNSFFDGEQVGLKPETKDIAKLLPIYMNEVNNAIIAKQFVRQMAKGKASDGRPLLAPTGAVKVVGEGDNKAYLVLPEMRPTEASDYKRLDSQPALHAWRWRAADEQGNPILVHGDLMVHPEAYTQLKNVLGQSVLREWYRSPSENPLAAIPKAAAKFLLDDVQQIGKATMLGFLSPFHAVQEGTHAIGHKVNPFFDIPKIDLSKPEQFDAAQHGLMLLPDRISAQQFREGLDGHSRNIAAKLAGTIPGVGKHISEISEGFQDWLFHSYIPGLKLKTYEHVLKRNTARYVDELASGEISQDQVKFLSAQQANAAYGHLNYADMNRNPTIQHLLQIGLLAPDFLEARGRFVGQAAKGLVGKSGREQLVAIATLALAQYTASRILNKLIDGDWHFDHPFSVLNGNREYTMRSVPEDIYKAMHDTRKFVSGRLSPLVGRGTLEGLTGRNYRGEETPFGETLKNLIAGMIPLTLQPMTRGLTETGKDNPVSPLEQFIGSIGVHVSRFSPVTEVYQLAGEWVEKHGKEFGLDPKKGTFPVSKYQQLRFALDDADFDKAKEEVDRLTLELKIPRSELDRRFATAMNHPFTGSTKTDEAFRKSLDEDDQQRFDAAKKRRQLLVDRLKKVR